MHRALPVALLLLAACSDRSLSRIHDHPPESAVIDVSPTLLDFGATTADAPVTRTVTVTNVSVAPFTIDRIWVEQAPEHFQVRADIPPELQAGEAFAVDVTFTPTAAAPIAGWLHVVSPDALNSAAEVDLIGAGRVPELYIDPPILDLGPVEVSCEATEPVRLVNVGSDTLVIDRIDLAGDRFIDVGLPATPLSLAPGEAEAVDVTYAPTAPGVSDAGWSVVSNDPAGPREAEQRGEGVPGDTVVDTFEVPDAPPLDILFAVDQSGSMEDETDRLAANVDRFIGRLDEVTDNWRVGVATKDSGCFTEAVLDATVRDYETIFADAVFAGDGGSRTEALLTVARNALVQARSGCNRGFVRADSRLHVILMSDEDDQSLGRVEDLVGQLGRLHPGGADRVIVSAVAGAMPDGCGTARAGTRYHEAATSTGGVFLSICDTDWARHVDALADKSAEDLNALTLSGTPDPSTVQVTVDGVPWPTGWHVDGDTLVFDAVPDSGASVEVRWGRGACR